MESVVVPGRQRTLGRAAPRWPDRPAPLPGAAVAAGAALAVLVGLDGSPVWQVVRVLGVAATTVGLVVALGRTPARWRGRLATFAGVPALAIAIGFAPHWVKGGPLAIQVAAAVLAGTGLGLTVGGTTVASAGRSWWRRGLAGLATAIVAVLVTFVLGQAVATTNVPRPALGAAPASVGLRSSEVTIPTADGVELAGWYVPSTNRAAVVLRHGAGSTRSGVLAQAAVLADAGYGVLMVDARGHGASTGRAMDFGWYGDADIAAATAHLAARPDVDPDRIGVVGMSMGGEEAIGASSADPLIRAVIAEGASARAAGDHGWLSERYGVRGAIQEQIQRVQDTATDLLTDAHVPRHAADGGALIR